MSVMTSQRRRARARRPRPDPVRVEELVAYLRADRGWRDEVAKRLVARLDQRLVRSARAYGCRPIAHVAEELDSQACVDLGPGVPYQLAKAVYGQVRLRGAARLRQTARSLRVLGVYLCKPRPGESGLVTINRAFYISAAVGAVASVLAASSAIAGASIEEPTPHMARRANKAVLLVTVNSLRTLPAGHGYGADST